MAHTLQIHQVCSRPVTQSDLDRLVRRDNLLRLIEDRIMHLPTKPNPGELAIRRLILQDRDARRTGSVMELVV